MTSDFDSNRVFQIYSVLIEICLQLGGGSIVALNYEKDHAATPGNFCSCKPQPFSYIIDWLQKTELRKWRVFYKAI